MLGQGKIKKIESDVSAITAEVAKIKDAMKDMQQLVKGQNQLLQKQQALLEQLTLDQQSQTKALEREVATLSGHNHELAKENHNLKSSRIELESKTTSTIKQQLGKAIQHIEHELSLDTSKVDALTKELGEIQQQLRIAQTAIAKLADAAEGVKASDLAIRDYAKELSRGDKEKLELMKKIDALEKLLASMKRSRIPHRH